MNIPRLSHTALSMVLAMTVVGCSQSSTTPAFTANFIGAGSTQTLAGLPIQVPLTGSGLTGSVGIPAPAGSDAGVVVGASISTAVPVGFSPPAIPAGATLVGFISVGFSQPVNLLAPLSLTSSLGSATAPSTVFAYTFSGGSWVPAAFNPGTISGGAPYVGVLVPTAVPTTYSIGTTYVYAIFRQ